jgi:hypothetical protein
MDSRDRAAVAEKLRDAYDRCALAQDSTRGGFVAYVRVTFDVVEQVHHGTTDYALAAWLDWRRAHPEPVRRVRGVLDYLVPDMEGDRTIETPALMVEAADGEQLALTGCSWGYGGEGCHGTALVLVDAGLCADLEAALTFVALRRDGSAWELPAAAP